jgi:hypothetical protein
MPRDPARFQIRKGNKGWLVWDSETRTTPEVDGRPAVGLSAETAWQFARRLNEEAARRKG